MGGNNLPGVVLGFFLAGGIDLDAATACCLPVVEQIWMANVDELVVQIN